MIWVNNETNYVADTYFYKVFLLKDIMASLFYKYTIVHENSSVPCETDQKFREKKKSNCFNFYQHFLLFLYIFN